MKKYQAQVDDFFDFEINKGEVAQLDLSSLDGNKFHILQEGIAYTAEVIRTDFAGKSFVIKVNGVEHIVQLKDHYDLLVKKMGLNVVSSAKMNELKAPMPGLVLDILVKEGDEFEKGTPLLILEAMKMENIIKATGEGTVKTVMVDKGQAVEKGQILLDLV